MGKSGKNSEKVCSLCGKFESKNWSYHWKSKHPDQEITELNLDKVPLNPLEGWWDLLPENLKEKYAAVNPHRN